MSAVLPIEPDNRFRRYTASAGQVSFSIPFPFQQPDDVKVVLYADGFYTELDRSLFTIVGANSPDGGTVLFDSGRRSGDVLGIVGSAILDRLSSVVRDGKFSSKMIDDEFDRNRIIQQEQQRDINRSLKLDIGIQFSIIQAPVEGSSLIWQRLGPFWSLANGPNAWNEFERLTVEIADRKQADLEEAIAREAADNALRNSINGILPAVTSLTARAEAAADASEAFSDVAQRLVEDAVSGFQGFQDGLAYDFGYITQPMTYFNRDFGSIGDAATN